MKITHLDFPQRQASLAVSSIASAGLTLIVGLATLAHADEAYAKSLLKNMSDYLSSQQKISFNYDTNLSQMDP
jgi:hypothetical protein